MFYYEQSFPYAYAPAWSYDFACRCFHTLRVRLLEDDASAASGNFDSATSRRGSDHHHDREVDCVHQ